MRGYVEFYADLYRERCFGRLILEASFDPNMVEMLQTPFEEEEIRSAVLGCNGDKVLGPYGFVLKL